MGESDEKAQVVWEEGTDTPTDALMVWRVGREEKRRGELFSGGEVWESGMGTWFGEGGGGKGGWRINRP